MVIRTYQPGTKHNLYDQSKHDTLAGVLYFRKIDDQIEEKSVPAAIFEPVLEEIAVPSDEPVTPVIDTLSERFLQFAFQIDRVVLGGFQKIAGLASQIQIPHTVATVPEVQKVVKKSVKTARKRVRHLRSKKTEEYVPKVELPTITIEFPQFKLPKVGVPTFSLPVVPLPKVNLTKLKLGIAALCLVFSFLSIGALLFPLISAQIFAMLPRPDNPVPTPTPLAYNSYYQAESDPLYPIREFRMVIPKINLESNIVDNVDPNIEGEYKDKLQYGVAHAKGSYLPAEDGGPVYLFAHSTDTIFNIARFNAKFYSVRELEQGDEIQVYFNGKEYRYRVREKFIIDPQQVDVIKNATDTDLILQTCWPPGTDWQRLIVYADRVEASVQLN